MTQPRLCDFHLHSSFSSDSDTPMENIIRSGIEKGASVLCMTEHMDMDFPKLYGMDFQVDMAAYRQAYEKNRDHYQDLLDLRFGIELGIQPHLKDRLTSFAAEHSFDFIIGSTHIVNGIDPYYPQFWEGREEYQAVMEYFETTLENIQTFSDIDVYGHIDYVIRYAPFKNQNYTYALYQEILDEILKSCIAKNIGIELNTGGYKYGLGHPNPCEEILKRYRELGGEIITLGSDAHTPQYVTYFFSQAMQVLRECGFTHYTIFKDRKPEFLPLV